MRRSLKRFCMSLIVSVFIAIFGGIQNIYAAKVNSSNVTVIDESNCGEFLNDTVNKLIDNGAKYILIKNGTYKLNSMININKPNIILRGENKNYTKLIQTNSHSDSIGVHKTNNVVVSNLTIDNSTNGDSAFSEGNSDNVVLQNCILYGQDIDKFTVYFAGKDYPDSISKNPVQGLENNDLDNNNKMIGNSIYSKFNGDGLSFSCQNNGLVENNKVYGTRIAAYVCKSCYIFNNFIKDSSSNGINISIPAADDVVEGNTIENSKTSAIRVEAEKEYSVAKDYYGKDIKLNNNIIKNPCYMGIELEQLADSCIEDNTIDSAYNDGIYLLSVDNIKVQGNSIFDSGNSKNKGNVWGWNEKLNSSVFIDYNVKKSVVEGNEIINTNFVCPFGIKEQCNNLNKENTIINNNIWGEFTLPIEQ